MKLWAGRFQKQTDALVGELNASIDFDQRLYRQDIEGSMAHARMLAACGILSQADASAICDGLQGILQDVQSGKVQFSSEHEDIHMNIEALLTDRIGEAGKRLHTARSRNDQVALDFRMYLREQIETIKGLVLELERTLVTIAKAHQKTIMPGYTHLQRAQPITLAQHLLAYGSMFRRDITRLDDCRARMNECPLGCGALAGTTHPIDRFQTAGALGFERPMANTLDGVSDRDYAVELLSDLSLIMMHLSRFCEEIILWCSWEFRFIELDDAFATGSSIMPQKKNPDVAELVRGKTGRVYGDLMGLLTVMKALPLAYNKDLQEDKEGVFDAVDTVKSCLPVFTAMLRTMRVREDKMRQAASCGFLNATDCADYLTKKGVPFRDAYKVSGRLVYYCTEHDKTLEELKLDELRQFSEHFDEDVYGALALDTCVGQRNSYGGPAPEQTSMQIEALEQFIMAQENGQA